MVPKNGCKRHAAVQCKTDQRGLQSTALTVRVNVLIGTNGDSQRPPERNSLPHNDVVIWTFF